MAETITAGRAGRTLRITRQVIPLMTDSELSRLLHMLMSVLSRLENETENETEDDNEYGHA